MENVASNNLRCDVDSNSSGVISVGGEGGRCHNLKIRKNMRVLVKM